jgi:hypothetical protein
VTPTPYEVLGVAEDASYRTVRAAYRKAAKLYHPDTGPSADAARFDAAAQAFEVLGDAAARGRLDAWLADTRAGRTPPPPPPHAPREPEPGWWVHDHPDRGRAPWSSTSGSTFQWTSHVTEPSVPPKGFTPRKPRVPRERFPLLGRLERPNFVPSLTAGAIVAALYCLLALLRFGTGMGAGVERAAGAVGPVHVAVAFAAATLVAWSALGVRPRQRAAVVASSVLVVGGAAFVTVVRSAWMWALIGLVVFARAATGSKPRI